MVALISRFRRPQRVSVTKVTAYSQLVEYINYADHKDCRLMTEECKHF